MTNLIKVEENHVKQSVGKHLEDKVPVVLTSATIADVEKLLLEKTAKFATVNYIYIVDTENILRGVVSIKEVFRSPKTTPVITVMSKDVVSVRRHTHQERAALLAVKHNLKAIPVTDKEGHFLGVVASDAILNILNEEHIDDLMHAAGVHRFDNPAKDLVNASAFQHIKKRVPWLALGLLGGIAATAIVSRFEAVLSANVLLAAFIPAIVYMADAVGTQTQTIFIRSLVIDRGLSLSRYAWRETQIGLVMATLFAVAIGVVSLAFWGSFSLALIFASSFFLTIALAMVVAMLLPLALDRTGIDPAVGSGPFATVVRDIMSLLVYFGVAHVLLSSFGLTIV